MSVYYEEINLESPKGDLNYYNVTEEVRKVVENSRIQNGICYIITLHTTCSVFFEEFSHDFLGQDKEFLQQDLSNVLDNLVPKFSESEKNYTHPGPLHIEFALTVGSNEYLTSNTDAHIRATIVGNNVVAPVHDNNLNLGRLGSIYFVDFDHRRTRKRKVLVQVMGD